MLFSPHNMSGNKLPNPRISGLPRQMRKSFLRALQLAGFSSQGEWLSNEIRRLIVREQKRFGGNLFDVLTDEEQDLLEVINLGAAEIQQIAEESLIPEHRVLRLIDDLTDRGFIEVRKKGGKTEQARGAVIKLYFVTEKYQPK